MALDPTTDRLVSVTRSARVPSSRLFLRVRPRPSSDLRAGLCSTPRFSPSPTAAEPSALARLGHACPRPRRSCFQDLDELDSARTHSFDDHHDHTRASTSTFLPVRLPAGQVPPQRRPHSPRPLHQSNMSLKVSPVRLRPPRRCRLQSDHGIRAIVQFGRHLGRAEGPGLSALSLQERSRRGSEEGPMGQGWGGAGRQGRTASPSLISWPRRLPAFPIAHLERRSDRSSQDCDPDVVLEIVVWSPGLTHLLSLSCPVPLSSAFVLPNRLSSRPGLPPSSRTRKKTTMARSRRLAGSQTRQR